MKVLAINTATSFLSLALSENDRVLYHFTAPEMRDQGNVLLGYLKQALDTQKWTFDDLDILAVVTGPGSFTGIRVGIATMRGIALAAKKPLLGFSSFDLFGEPKAGYTNIIAVESWRDELYFAVRDGQGQDVLPPMNVTPQIFSEQFKNKYPDQESIIISGDVASRVKSFFPDAAIIEELNDVRFIARLAIKTYKTDMAIVKPVPYYMREADVTIALSKTKILEGK